MKYLGIPQSGSLAGTVYSHNRAGQYTRNRRAPVQPIGTGRRALIRSAFSAGSSAWGALSAVNQALWTAYANEYPITDALGQSITLTGQQAYVGIYVNLINLGLAAPTAPPATNAVFTPIVATFAPNETTTPVFTPTFTAIPTGGVMAIAVSQQVGPGVGFWATWWQIGTYAATIASAVLLAPYIAHFGTLTTGRKIFGKFTPFNTSGVKGQPVITSAVVT